MVEIAEKAFESAIEATLLAGGPDAPKGGVYDLAAPPADAMRSTSHHGPVAC